MNAARSTVALFVWGAYTTTAPPSPVDQRIIRDVRDRGQVTALAFPLPALPRGDNRGAR